MLTVMTKDTYIEDIFTNVSAAIKILTENNTYFDDVSILALMGARLRYKNTIQWSGHSPVIFRLGMITGDFLASLSGIARGASVFLVKGTKISVKENLGKPSERM